MNSYTLETSFSGADFGPNRGYHFHQSHLMSMGRSLCEALLDYSEESQTHFRMALEELRLLYPTLPTEQGSSGGDDGGRCVGFVRPRPYTSTSQYPTILDDSVMVIMR